MARKKKKKGNALNNIILIVGIVVIIFALYNLIPALLDYRQAEQTYQGLTQEYVTQTDVAPEDDSEATVPMDQPDWLSASINFEGLKAVNPEVMGWIRFDRVDVFPIDYPIMYSGDNDKYLRTDLYGEEHTAGSIFLEAKNAPDFSNTYNIVYGHNMKDGSMFGQLKNYKKDLSVYDDNQFFTIYTPDAAYRYQIFAFGEVHDDDQMYTVGYQHDEEYQSLIDYMVKESRLDTGIHPDMNDQVVTLSTCTASGENYRLVLNAVCVDKYEY